MSRVIVFSFVAILWTSDLWNQSNAAESPKVFQVEASGQAGITRIQAAVDAAPAGSIIRIVSGIFHEAALISKPLTRERAGVDRTFLSANWVDTREIILEEKVTEKESQIRTKRNLRNCEILRLSKRMEKVR